MVGNEKTATTKDKASMTAPKGSKPKAPAGVPSETLELFAKAMRPEYLAENGHLVGRPQISAVFKGRRFVAVGSRIYHDLPPELTFHEFIVMFLKDILGRDWGLAELAKPRANRHPILQWLHALAERQNAPPAAVHGAVREVEHTGSTLALLTLAYDAYSIYHCAELPESLIKRLKHSAQFQGAKYEIAVAGLFARAGFTIGWIGDNSRKRPEFLATHKTTGERLVVEAKSRHRPGVLTQPGPIDVGAMKADLGRLVKAALEKETDGLPYVIYLDANLPMTDTDNPLARAWVKDIQSMLDQYGQGTASQPDPFTAITVTNFSWHYVGNTAEPGRSESLMVLPKYSAAALKDRRTLDLIFQAANQYGAVPPDFPPD